MCELEMGLFEHCAQTVKDYVSPISKIYKKILVEKNNRRT